MKVKSMPFPNDRFDPNWEAAHDHHAAERNRVYKELEKLDWPERSGSGRGAALNVEFDYHQEGCYQALLSQHRTVQDYAEWRMSHWPLGRDLERLGQFCDPPDFSGMKTIEEVDAEHSRLDHRFDLATAEIRGRRTTGQPPGLLAFANARSPGLTQYWREFSSDELYVSGHYGSSGARALVTVELQADGWHVCFMQEPDVKGVSVTNSIETLATCLYREIRRRAGVDGVRFPNPLATLRHRWATRHLRVALAPDRFHFYQHTCAVPGMSEDFDRVQLRFEEGKFRNPKWIGFKVIPAVIQQARYECDRDAAAATPRVLLTEQAG